MNPNSRLLFMVGYLIASLYIVLSILGITYAVSFATYLSVAVYYCLIIYFALNIICSLLVFVGIKKRESLFLLNWLVVQLIPLCYVILTIILQPKLDTILIISIVIGCVFHIFLWAIMVFVSRQCGQHESDEYISPEYFFYRKERVVNTGKNNHTRRYAQSDFSYMEPTHSYDVGSHRNFRNNNDSGIMNVGIDSGDGQHELPRYFYNQHKRKTKGKNNQNSRYRQSDSNYMEPSHVLSISDLMYQSGSAWSSVGNSGLGYVSHHSDVGLHSSSHYANDSGFMSGGGGGGGTDSGGGGGFDSGGGGCDSGGGGDGGGGGGGCD